MSGSYWLRLDADAPEHPKIIGLDDRAFRLWVAGLCYCARHLTDGKIPAGALPKLCPDRGRIRAAKTLVTSALWDMANDGWTIHDWHHYQPAAGAEKARRTALSEARAAAGRKGAEARWGMAKAMANGWQAPSHDHVHSPDPENLASEARGDKTFYTPEKARIPDPERALVREDLGQVAPMANAMATVEAPLPDPEAVKGPGVTEPDRPAVEQNGTVAGLAPIATGQGTSEAPASPSGASGDDLLTLLGELVGEGHPWGTTLQARVLERGGRLSTGERRRLREIAAERAVAPSGPRRGVVKGLTSIQPAGGWRPAERIAG